MGLFKKKDEKNETGGAVPARQVTVRCSECNGTGKCFGGGTCWSCNGVGNEVKK